MSLIFNKKSFLVVCFLLVFIGCEEKEPTGSITGQVTVKGSPFTEGFVGIYCREIKLNQTAVLDASGNYRFPEVPSGEYVVLVSPRSMEDDEEKKKCPVPKRLRRKETTDLNVAVKVGEESLLNIELSQ